MPAPLDAVTPTAQLPAPGAPMDGTITERRSIRQDTRHALGVGRSDAPTLRELARAVRLLHRLVYLTSGGRWALAVVPAKPDGLSEWARSTRTAAWELTERA